MATLTINPAYRALLEANGLADFDALFAQAKSMAYEFGKAEYNRLARKNTWRVALNRYVWLTQGNRVNIYCPNMSLTNKDKAIMEVEERFSKSQKYTATLVVQDVFTAGLVL